MSTNTPLYLDIHVLQTLPPSNVNRDDQGAPKSAYYGGVPRQRVSSQSWKKAIRDRFGEVSPQLLGVRTKMVVKLLVDTYEARHGISEQDRQLVTDALSDAATLTLVKKAEDDESGALFLFSRPQVEAIVDVVHAELELGSYTPPKRDEKGNVIKPKKLTSAEKKAAEAAGDTPEEYAAGGKFADEKATKSALVFALSSRPSLDTALFGRMSASNHEFSVDASAQVAHALSVHRVDNESDYYTASDDVKSADPTSDSGQAMLGYIEFASATLYRFATVNVRQLARTLGDDVSISQAVSLFLDAFVTTVPGGKKSSFAPQGNVDQVLVTLRTGQPVNYVAAFEEPVRSTSGYRAAASGALVRYVSQSEAAFGSSRVVSFSVNGPQTTAPDETWTSTSLPALTPAVADAVTVALS